MKKLIIAVVLLLSILPLSAIEIDVGSGITPCVNIFYDFDGVKDLMPELQILQAGFNFNLSNDWFISLRIGGGFLWLVTAGVGFGRDFPLNETHSLRISETISYSFCMLDDSAIESSTEVLWHPYRKSGIYAGGGLKLQYCLGGGMIGPMWTIGLPLKVGYSFCF